MDIDIDMTNCIRNQHTEDIAVNVIQWKNECHTGRRKNESHIYTKRKMVQRKMEL